MQKNGLYRKIWSISKFKMSQPGKQTITMHILPNISRSKGNKAIEFRRLIKYNIRNFFVLKNLTQNVVEKLIPETLFENSKLSISLYQYSKVLFFLVSLYAKLSAIKIYWNYCKPIAFTSFNAFLRNGNFKKQKKVWNYSHCLFFCIICEEKYYPCYILLPEQILLPCCLYLVRYWLLCIW